MSSRSSYLRLNPLPFSSLPSNPTLDQGQEHSSRPTLEKFLTSVLNEAHTLISDTIPRTFKADPKLRSSSPSTAKVQLLTSSIPSNSSKTTTSAGDAGKQDYWVCRKSVHTDQAQKGSASWAEFQEGLRTNHSENEMDYTPTVASVEHLVQWPVVDALEGGWRGVDMHVNLITHTFKPGALISPRTFASLVISAYEPPIPSKDGSENDQGQGPLEGFYTIQIPVLFSQDSPDDVPETLRNKITSAVPKNTIFAYYASVERVRLLPAVGTTESENATDAKHSIEWIMATTSDAGGHIPQWVQRSWTMGGVPKAVVADVGLFLGWANKKRRA